MQHPFAKYVGCGNDFIIFDNRTLFFPIEDKKLIQRLCNRQVGIGADGILLLESSAKADFRMRIFNPDGSEAEMCGNGIRCLIQYLSRSDMKRSSYKIETLHRVLTAISEGFDVQVEMGSPTSVKWNLSIFFKGKSFQTHFLDTGVPHVVVFVKDLNEIDLKEMGSYFRYHSEFSPQGTNVNLAQLSADCIKIRTYERGVEAETLACGTGATAVALAAAFQFKLNSPIIIETRLKELLTIGFERTSEEFSRVTMKGPAFYTFQGTTELYP